MSTRTTLTYFLPVTKVHLRATVTSTTDTVLEATTREISGVSIDLVTVADTGRARTLTVDSGWWRDFSFTLGLTEDGRLTTVGVESTGRVGTAVSAGVAAVLGAAALATCSIPMAALAAAAGAITRNRGGLESVRPDIMTAPEPSDPVTVAYAAAHPAAAGRLAALIAERSATVQAVDEARAAYRAGALDPQARLSARAAYRATREVLADVEAELGRARAHFAAWRASTLTQSTQVLDVLVPLESLPTFNGSAISTPAAPEVAEFFAVTGVVMARRSGTQTVIDPTRAAGASADGVAAVRVLRPREVVLVTLGGTSDALVATAVTRALVMDRACAELALPVRKSWNAKRRIQLALSELGALTTLDVNGTSEAAALGAAATEAGSALAGGLESAGTTLGHLDTLVAAGPDRELAQLKRLVAVQEQRLLAVGQAATAEDYARLARLQQRVDEAALEAKLAGTQSRV